MEVVQRLALGPKQGIAVVRVGERLLAVSLGEGGVRPLLELGDAERAMLAAPAPARDGALASHGGPLVERGHAPAPAILPPIAATVAAAPIPAVRRATLLTPLAPASAVPEAAEATQFGALLRGALRGGATALLPLVLGLALPAAPGVAGAQGAPAVVAPVAA